MIRKSFPSGATLNPGDAVDFWNIDNIISILQPKVSSCAFTNKVTTRQSLIGPMMMGDSESDNEQPFHFHFTENPFS